MIIKRKLEEKIAERDAIMNALGRVNIAIELLEEMLEESDDPITPSVPEPKAIEEMDNLDQKYNLPVTFRKIAWDLRVKDKDRDTLRKRIEDAGFFVATLPIWRTKIPELTVFKNKGEAIMFMAGHGPIKTPIGPLKNMKLGVFGMSTAATQLNHRSVDSMVTFMREKGFHVLKNGDGMWKLDRTLPDCSHLIAIMAQDPTSYTSITALRNASGIKYIPYSPFDIRVCLSSIMKGGVIELNHNYNAVRFVPQQLKAVG